MSKSWQLEVLKMTLYIGFPVGVFYLANHPAVVERILVKDRDTIFPPSPNGKDPKDVHMAYMKRREAFLERERLLKEAGISADNKSTE